MSPTLPQRDQEEILLLMAAVDAAFAEGDFTLGDELDAWLEQHLDDLDHRLSDLDEAGDVLDGDNHVGIEDQLIAAWSQVLFGTVSFAPPGQDAELASHLRSVLSDEALTGALCSPTVSRRRRRRRFDRACSRPLERAPGSHPRHEIAPGWSDPYHLPSQAPTIRISNS